MINPYKKNAKLVLSNGIVFPGFFFGASGTAIGEIVFNTGMTGYQEVITDPSYYGQILTFTFPEIGNTGINFEDSAAEPLILINPEITDFGTTLNSYEEGCLSIPGVYLNVVRPSTIKLKFRDEMGRPRKMKADGLLARCIQHEMDHLNGILFVERVTSKDDLNKELLKEGFNEKDVISIN